MTSSNFENYLTLRDSHSVYVQDGTKNIFRVRNILRNDIQKVPLTNKPVALNAENLDDIIKHSVTLLVKHAGYVDMSADACEMLMNLVKKSLNETCKQFSISKRRRVERKPTAFSNHSTTFKSQSSRKTSIDSAMSSPRKGLTDDYQGPLESPSMLYKDFSVEYTDIHERMLGNIHFMYEVENLSPGRYYSPPKPVTGYVLPVNHRFMIPLPCRKFNFVDKTENEKYPTINVWFLIDLTSPFTCLSRKSWESVLGREDQPHDSCFNLLSILDPNACLQCFLSKPPFEEVNILGADSFEELKLSLVYTNKEEFQLYLPGVKPWGTCSTTPQSNMMTTGSDEIVTKNLKLDDKKTKEKEGIETK